MMTLPELIAKWEERFTHHRQVLDEVEHTGEVIAAFTTCNECKRILADLKELEEPK